MDLSRLKELIQLMDRNQLVELEVEAEGTKVRLRKKGETVREVVSMAGMPMAATAPAAAPGAAAPAGGDGADSVPEENLIRAPMVGTYYRSPSPESDPFVEVGDKIEEGQTLCIIEAMKVMNEVKAERSGVLEAMMVENGESVEYGTPLFRIN